jgi:periplasmic protein TonB
MSEDTNKTNRPEKLPVITPGDRFGLTLCLAIITHAVVVLGVTFTKEDVLPPRYDAMEIILVQQKSEAPDEAKLLAQANLEGGGDTDDEVTPASPLPTPFPDNIAELATPLSAESAMESVSDSSQAILTAQSAETEILAETNIIKADEIRQPEHIVEKSKPQNNFPTATALVANSMKIAALSAEIQRKLENRAERPRRKYISASTREFIYAAYMEAWRAKVERIGNLNYPDTARQQRLSGNLILDVALNRDGSINDIIIRRSSGHKILDDAAIRIVNLAAPYSPFPEDIRAETDILHITRTWQFLNSGGFR